jgi:hypothetical protein
MEPWDKVTRNDWIVMDEFEAIWNANGGPVDAALFVIRNLRDRTNEFYFTPEATVLAASLLGRYGAVPSVPPDFTNRTLLGPSLLVGDERILDKNGW